MGAVRKLDRTIRDACRRGSRWQAALDLLARMPRSRLPSWALCLGGLGGAGGGGEGGRVTGFGCRGFALKVSGLSCEAYGFRQLGIRV